MANIEKLAETGQKAVVIVRKACETAGDIRVPDFANAIMGEVLKNRVWLMDISRKLDILISEISSIKK